MKQSIFKVYFNIIQIVIECGFGSLGLDAISNNLHYVTNLLTFAISDISNCQSSLQKLIKSIKQLSLLNLFSCVSIDYHHFNS